MEIFQCTVSQTIFPLNTSNLLDLRRINVEATPSIAQCHCGSYKKFKAHCQDGDMETSTNFGASETTQNNVVCGVPI